MAQLILRGGHVIDPSQNIDWKTPEGGGGPNYPGGM